MLHILWLILKFILIILGILLGLLLLAVLLVLFCPVRYKASAVKAEGGWKQTEGEGIVSWLFHGISLRAEWKDQQMEISFHLFGIPVDKLLKKRQEKRAVTKKSGKNPEKSGAEKVSVSGTDGNREEEHKKSVVDHPKSENMETEDLKTDRNSASDTSADTERIRNSQISGQQELNADDTDRNSGIDTARKLREQAPTLPIVFVTSSKEYVWQTFPVHPFDYLLKPFEQARIRQLLDDLLRILQHPEPEIEVRFARKLMRLPYSKVYYALAQNHFVRIMSDEGECRATGIFAQVEKELCADPRFLVCNRGIIINMSAVLRFENDCIQMLDGTQFPVRQKDKGRLFATFTQYQFRHMRREI